MSSYNEGDDLLLRLEQLAREMLDDGDDYVFHYGERLMALIGRRPMKADES